ncbi:hypothetical protein N7456_005644 [Penicillium angulare]|uniref:Uncharacterized protein n=1 Tax=Penicillium angulare TaxID=116970 RepID=A0A9W9FYR6_9EURO|nr:hypothetical protein N7456_005644 [Penicillium angulare]
MGSSSFEASGPSIVGDVALPGRQYAESVGPFPIVGSRGVGHFFFRSSSSSHQPSPWCGWCRQRDTPSTPPSSYLLPAVPLAWTLTRR